LPSENLIRFVLVALAILCFLGIILRRSRDAAYDPDLFTYALFAGCMALLGLAFATGGVPSVRRAYVQTFGSSEDQSRLIFEENAAARAYFEKELREVKRGNLIVFKAVPGQPRICEVISVTNDRVNYTCWIDAAPFSDSPYFSVLAEKTERILRRGDAGYNEALQAFIEKP